MNDLQRLSELVKSPEGKQKHRIHQEFGVFVYFNLITGPKMNAIYVNDSDA